MHALGFGHDSTRRLLASAAQDCVLLWDVDERTCLELQRDCGMVSHLAFTADDAQVVVCIASRVFVVDTGDASLLACVDVHARTVTSLVTSVLSDHSFIVTASEDRTFVLWDVTARRVCMQSGVDASTPLCAVAMHARTGLLCSASSDSILRMYRISNGAAELLFRLDLPREIPRVKAASSSSPHKASSSQLAASPAPQAHSDTVVLSLLFADVDDGDDVVESTAAAGLALLNPLIIAHHPRQSRAPMLSIATSWCHVVLDCHSRCLVTVTPYSAVSRTGEEGVTMASCVQQQCGEQVLCLLGEPFRPVARIALFRQDTCVMIIQHIGLKLPLC